MHPGDYDICCNTDAAEALLTLQRHASGRRTTCPLRFVEENLTTTRGCIRHFCQALAVV